MNKLLSRSRRRKSDIRERPGAALNALSTPAVAEPLDDRDRVLPALLTRVDGPPLDTAGNESAGAGSREIERLYAALGRATAASSPRTFKLLDSSTRKISQKVIEEAGEVALEAVERHASGVVRESADLLYHLVVLWRRAGIEPTEIWEEMRARADAFGIAEKLPKSLGRKAAVAKTNRSTFNEQEG
jgi:phosphoribosyl-ATP pyrophosphohydrolase